MKIKKLSRRLTKELGIVNGYVRLDTISICDPDGEDCYIEIKGAYGVSDGEDNSFQNDFELFYPDGSSIEYVAGLFRAAMDADGR